MRKKTAVRLTNEQFMRCVRQVHDLANVRVAKFAEDEQEQIKQWLRTYAELLNLCVLTSVSAREEILQSLEVNCVRVFLLELSISFFAHGGDTDDFEERLANSIASGLLIDGKNPMHCELPQEVLLSAPLTNFPATFANRFVLAFMRMTGLTSETTLSEYLLSNRHMQMIVLLALSDDLD